MGIRERCIVNRDAGESSASLSATALTRAVLAEARLAPDDLDLILIATMTSPMACPSAACLVANQIKATRCAAFDLNGACSGFVFGLNVAHDMIRAGTFKPVGLVLDTLSKYMSYDTNGRGTAIIFGDGAGAVVPRATDDQSKGVLEQAMHADGEGWKDIYIPEVDTDFPPGLC